MQLVHTDSMESLVWDFGQLNSGVEKLYIKQIVKRYVSKQREFKDAGLEESRLIDTITDVLAAAQLYMREQKDECSFVSLRDVERAMIVMKWFYWLCREILDEFMQAEEREAYTVSHSQDGEERALTNQPTVSTRILH